MSGVGDGRDEDDDRDGLAAEYVLGTLDPLERAYVERRAGPDREFAAMIAAWQVRLSPLDLLITPVQPPADLWRRIARAIDPPRARPMRVWSFVGFWRAATAGGFALAAALAIFLILRPAAAPQAFAALAPTGGGAPVFIAELISDGTLRLQPVGPVTIPSDRDLQLWALPVGATRPTSLGLLPTVGRGPTAADLPARTQLLVSLEPRGGSPTGQPTGPVVYGGVLTAFE